MSEFGFAEDPFGAAPRPPTRSSKSYESKKPRPPGVEHRNSGGRLGEPRNSGPPPRGASNKASSKDRPKPRNSEHENFGSFDEFETSNAFGYEEAAPSSRPAPPKARRSRRASISGPSRNDSLNADPATLRAIEKAANAFDDNSYDPEPAAPEPAAPQRRRTRRASMYGDGAGAAAAAAAPAPPTSSRPPSSRQVNPSRSCDGLEAMRGSRTRSSRSSDSVESGDSGSDPNKARRGRRSGPSSMDNQDADYGYGDAQPTGFGNFETNDSADYGYGEEESAPADWLKDRSSNQRKLLDNFRGGDIGGGGGGPTRQSSSRNALAAQNAANIMLPMAADMEKQPQRPRRRASLIGAIGVGPKADTLTDDADKNRRAGLSLFKDRKKTKSPDDVPQYDPSKDRDRRNANSLLERVSAGAGERGSRNLPGTSYSDRIMQGGR